MAELTLKRAVAIRAAVSLALSAVSAGAIPSAMAQKSASVSPAAPIDVTGYWVSVITEDWRLRMITPPKGDYQNVPLNSSGIAVLNSWSPEADRAGGNACAAYGAAAAMRMPTRMHVTWQDPSTLRWDFDYGQQTRLVNFGSAIEANARSWQGFARGEWIDMNGRRYATVQGRPAERAGLKITTTHLKAQYLRKNGIPVSESATVTDMVERITGPGHREWLIVKTIIHDPVYLAADLVTSSQYAQETDGSRWAPTPCEVDTAPAPRPLRELPMRPQRPPASVVTP